MELKEVTYSEVSQIQCKVFHGASGDRKHIVVMQFIGKYRDGCLGNPDAAFMDMMVTAALTAWEPSAAIIDLSQLNYVWGDMLEMIFPDDAGELGPRGLPSALVVGEECREAIRTLIFGVNGTESLSEVAWVHESLDDALST